jgi:glycyl-radical enzyme activating protein
MTEGLIFNIQRSSIHDGPGIRTTVFFKGCSLRCRWCHNPESLHLKPDLLFYPDKCISCFRCLPLCPEGCHEKTVSGHRFNRESCRNCGACAEVCPAEALQLAGKKVTSREVAEEVVRDLPFYRSSGGGVTLSGGEPLLQPAFAEDILTECRNRGIHTAVDTAGNVSWKHFQKILPVTGLFLYDMKAGREETHRSLTGSSNRRIIENLTLLSESGANIIIRIPIIPGYNDVPGEMERIAENLINIKINEVELLPYHRLGGGKYQSLGITEPGLDTDTPAPERIAEIRSLFLKEGLNVM